MLKSKDVLELDSLLILVKWLSIRRSVDNGERKKEDVRHEREPFAMVKGHVKCMLPLCHPFTAIISGPTGCGKTAWVLRLIDNIREKI